MQFSLITGMGYLFTLNPAGYLVYIYKMSLRFAPGCGSEKKIIEQLNFVAGRIMAVQGLRKRHGKRSRL
jgi:hypothetical protein